LVFSKCLGHICGPMRYYETPVRSDVHRCGLMWSDAVIRPTLCFCYLGILTRTKILKQMKSLWKLMKRMK